MVSPPNYAKASMGRQFFGVLKNNKVSLRRSLPWAKPNGLREY